VRQAAVPIAAAMLLATRPLAAQFGGSAACSFSYDESGYFISPFWVRNPTYDGHVTFVRIKYRGNWACANEGPGWAHDYPVMESHFMNIMQAITSIHPFIRKGDILGSTLLSWNEPELFKYPVAYVSEPYGWDLNASEMEGFKRYIQRGGFVIFDDMGWRNVDHLTNLLTQWHRAFPQAKLVELTHDAPIFSAFFKVNLTLVPGRYSPDCGCPARYYGIYENNDPRKRMLAVINDHQDFGEYIQWSEQGLDIVPSNEAYKLMVNYYVYALTH
jgi:hypothetical protein